MWACPVTLAMSGNCRLAPMSMLVPWIVAEMVPARNARLLLLSSQANPPSSRQSFQDATVNFTASIVSLLLMTTLPAWSISAPPKPQVREYAQLLGSPRLWPNACPYGRPFFFSATPSFRHSSQVSGNLPAPSSLSQSSRYAHVAGTEQSGTAFHRPPTTLTILLCS